MKTYRNNGEYWYADRRSPFQRARMWLIWFGGWEKANGTGWALRRRRFPGARTTVADPTPVSILGHRLTFFGTWLQVRLPHTYLVLRYRGGYSGGPYAYLSNDGTPSRAHHWLFGAPREVIGAVAQHDTDVAEREARYAMSAAD